MLQSLRRESTSDQQQQQQQHHNNWKRREGWNVLSNGNKTTITNLELS